MFNMKCFITPLSFIPFSRKACEKMKQRVLFCTIFVTPGRCQDHWKWSEMKSVMQRALGHQVVLHISDVGCGRWSGAPPLDRHRLVGLVVKASASRAGDPGFESRLRRVFSGSSHTSDLKIGTPVATLPGAWLYRVSTGTGRPGVSILWLGEVERWICNIHLSVAARKIVWADPSLRYTSLLLGR